MFFSLVGPPPPKSFGRDQRGSNEAREGRLLEGILEIEFDEPMAVHTKA